MRSNTRHEPDAVAIAAGHLMRVIARMPSRTLAARFGPDAAPGLMRSLSVIAEMDRTPGTYGAFARIRAATATRERKREKLPNGFLRHCVHCNTPTMRRIRRVPTCQGCTS